MLDRVADAETVWEAVGDREEVAVCVGVDEAVAVHVDEGDGVSVRVGSLVGVGEVVAVGLADGVTDSVAVWLWVSVPVREAVRLGEALAVGEVVAVALPVGVRVRVPELVAEAVSGLASFAGESKQFVRHLGYELVCGLVSFLDPAQSVAATSAGVFLRTPPSRGGSSRRARKRCWLTVLVAPPPRVLPLPGWTPAGNPTTGKKYKSSWFTTRWFAKLFGVKSQKLQKSFSPSQPSFWASSASHS